MSRVKKKRQTKHRGNAAGVVESRGRTGRKPTDAERKGSKGSGPRLRQDRFDRPPTWRGAFNRSLIAIVIFVAAMILFFGQSPASTAAVSVLLLVVYVPMSYYLDLWLHRRRLSKRAAGGQGPKGA
ncbi:unannotated protein [freshwater metagenome]|uniref:Unannotated protein n=1 Tax=freshwater metagenome TaxID=449393 RepID=A0A6J7D860_9ZZZZ|nr:hypothetical protein [Actinomycetota bacterium]